MPAISTASEFFTGNSIRQSSWGGSAWNIGVAPTWTSEDGSLEDFEWSGAGFWSTLAYGFEDIKGLNENAQLLFHARYRIDEQAPAQDQDSVFFEQNSMTLAGQLKIAGPSFATNSVSREGGPDLNFSFEVAYIDEDRKGRDDETLFRYTLGAEYRLLEDVYLKISLGTESGRDDEDDQAFALGRVKWGFNTPAGSGG